MVITRPSAVLGLPGFFSWWDSGESLATNRGAAQARMAGDFPAAESLYRAGYRRALQQGDRRTAARYLVGVGGADFARLQYREALATYLEARLLAQEAGDWTDWATAALDLSSLYLQVWDVDSGRRSIEEAYRVSRRVPDFYNKPELLMQLGRLHAELGLGTAEPLLEQAIESVWARSDKNLPQYATDNAAREATGWDRIGEIRLSRGDLQGAEQAHAGAFRLRLLLDPRDLGVSYGSLEVLQLAEGHIVEAERFIQLALATNPGGSRLMLLMNQRGRIRLAQGKTRAALDDFFAAIQLSDQWGLGLPAMSPLLGSSAQLEKRIFDSFIETAAAYAFATGDQRWSRESLQAVQLNRTTAFEGSLALMNQKLPPEFWEILNKLKAEETRSPRAKGSQDPEADRLRLRITEMESAVALEIVGNNKETFHQGESLTHIQRGLSTSEVLLSFHLGEAESYMWAATRTSLSLYKIGPREQIQRAVREFREAVRTGGSKAPELGERLYVRLFGELHREEADHAEWLLALDDVLFQLPFGALVAERRSGGAVYLAEKHTIEIVSGAAARTDTAARRVSAGGRFLAVADPIYNIADPRWRVPWKEGPLRYLKSNLLPRAWLGESGQSLNRLVGTMAEVNSSTAAWGADATVLSGSTARMPAFLDALKPAPAIVHLATHVLADAGPNDQALVAFGLGPSGLPEYLAAREVVRQHVPGALVVMTGCGTATGDIRAGAGLLGLTRAWMLAGAGTVVATQWPVRDSRGELWEAFYRHLRQEPAAQALRAAQMEMMRAGKSLESWAAVESFGGTQ